MDEMQFLGLLISAVITLGGFIAIIMKFVQPINDLRIVIQKLNDNIDAIKNQNETHEMRITQHGKEIDDLGTRVGTLETKMDVYHK